MTGRPPLDARLLAAAACAVALALCWPALEGLAVVWRDSRFYGHGYAMPAFALWLAWSERGRLAAGLRPLQPPAAGAPIVLAVGLLEVVAILGDVRFVAGLGIPLLLGATAYAIGGRALLRPLLLPLCVLALMVPPPGLLKHKLLFELKLLVTDAAVGLTRALGEVVTAEGNQILIPGQTLFVSDACSGLTSIVTLLPLACIVAYFLTRGVWRRALVMASVVPLALGANVARVAATVLIASHAGAEAAQGLVHEGFGVASYVLGTLALVGVARALP